VLIFILQTLYSKKGPRCPLVVRIHGRAETSGVELQHPAMDEIEGFTKRRLRRPLRFAFQSTGSTQHPLRQCSINCVFNILKITCTPLWVSAGEMGEEITGDKMEHTKCLFLVLWLSLCVIRYN